MISQRFDGEQGGLRTCLHAYPIRFHVNRDLPATVIICPHCATVLRVRPDRPLDEEIVVIDEREKRVYVDRPAEMGTRYWALFGLFFFIVLLAGISIGMGL